MCPKCGCIIISQSKHCVGGQFFCFAWSICEKMLEAGSLARSFHSVGRIKPWDLEMFDKFSNAAWKDSVSAVVRGSFRMMGDVGGGETVFNSVVNGYPL